MWARRAAVHALHCVAGYAVNLLAHVIVSPLTASAACCIARLQSVCL